MPIQISLPPTSLTPYKNFYNMVFALRSRPIYSSIVSIGLKRASNSSYDYSVATFRKVRDLTGEELANMQAYATTFREQLKTSLSEQAASLEMDTGSVEVGSAPMELPDNGDHFSIGTGVVDGEREQLPA